MDSKQRLDPSVPIEVFERVVPTHLLDIINASIDAARHEWRPQDGRRASSLAKHFAELLRTTEAFRKMEMQACAAARRWAGGALNRELAGEPLYVLRRVSPSMFSQSYLRHFDSHILTLLIPLQLAEAREPNGDLIVCLRQRQSFSALTNVAVKTWLFFEHRFPFPIRRMLFVLDERRQRYERIACVPGNVYVFNGFITLHHNLHVATGERRSLVIHYYDSGLTIGARSIIRTLRALRDSIGDLA